MTDRTRALIGPPPTRSPRTHAQVLARRWKPARGSVGVLACLAVVLAAASASPAMTLDHVTVPSGVPTLAAHPPAQWDYPAPEGGISAAQAASDGADRGDDATAIAIGALGIPRQVAGAYVNAAELMADRDPRCHLEWSVLAGIGRIESGHARGGALRADGTTVTPILGPRLDGTLDGTAIIRDTTGGRYDGDPVYDRAVGPMQFLPGTWLTYGQDGNDDAERDPHNIHDATLASAVYLCAGDRDLSQRAQLERAVFSYNPSTSYVRAVLAWADAYAAGGAVPADSHVALAAGTKSANAEVRGGKPTPTLSTRTSSEAAPTSPGPSTVAATRKPSPSGATQRAPAGPEDPAQPDADPASPMEEREPMESCDDPTTEPSESSSPPSAEPTASSPTASTESTTASPSSGSTTPTSSETEPEPDSPCTEPSQGPDPDPDEPDPDE